jgi:hypothetical protein
VLTSARQRARYCTVLYYKEVWKEIIRIMQYELLVLKHPYNFLRVLRAVYEYSTEKRFVSFCEVSLYHSTNTPPWVGSRRRDKPRDVSLRSHAQTVPTSFLFLP